MAGSIAPRRPGRRHRTGQRRAQAPPLRKNAPRSRQRRSGPIPGQRRKATGTWRGTLGVPEVHAARQRAERNAAPARHMPRTWCRVRMQSSNCYSESNKQSISIAQSLAVLMRDANALRQLHAVAERYGRLPHGSLASREIVADVIGDACTGVLDCDPTAPAPQLMNEIRRRATRLHPSTKKRVRLVSVDDVRPAVLRRAMELRSSSSEDHAALDVADLPELMSQVRLLAAGDAAVMKLLDMYQRGLICRSDAIRAGIPRAVYRQACARLDAYAASVREQAAEQMAHRTNVETQAPSSVVAPQLDRS